MMWLLALVPLSWALAGFHAPPLWIFGVAGLAIVPLADGVRRATEALAGKFGSAVGGLLNMTFGNMTELLLSFFVLWAGHAEVVKAAIIGSIVCNSLLALGLAIVWGSWKREQQTFPRARAGLLSSLLTLSVIALLIPALFDYTERGLLVSANPGAREERLSLWTSLILIVIYAANLVYTFVTHRDVFSRHPESDCRNRARQRTRRIRSGRTRRMRGNNQRRARMAGSRRINRGMRMRRTKLKRPGRSGRRLAF